MVLLNDMATSDGLLQDNLQLPEQLRSICDLLAMLAGQILGYRMYGRAVGFVQSRYGLADEFDEGVSVRDAKYVARR